MRRPDRLRRGGALVLAADIKRFLERPTADCRRSSRLRPAPPGAPIGDLPPEWLARPPYKQ